MITRHRILDLVPYINWTNYFTAWGFDKKFASIANVEGCDVVRASWLTDFEVKDRTKASEAMQLLKEAYREIPELDQYFQLFTLHKPVSCQVEESSLLINGIQFPLLEDSINTSKPTSILAYATTVDRDMENMYANNEHKHKLVMILAAILVDAATQSILKSEKIKDYKMVDIHQQTSKVQQAFDQLVDLDQLGITLDPTFGKNTPISTKFGFIV